jgi:hypothetical protein
MQYTELLRKTGSMLWWIYSPLKKLQVLGG